MARLIFLTLWTTVCGPLSGFAMGLFFVALQDGLRRGVLAPQGERPLVGFLEACRVRMRLSEKRSFAEFAKLTTSRLSVGHR